MDGEGDNPKISERDAGGYLLFYLGILYLNEKWIKNSTVTKVPWLRLKFVVA